MTSLGKLKACLDYFKITSMESFENRFLVQKYIYLSQRLGLKLGYVYNLYHRGPYASPLAGAAFTVLDESSSLVEEKLNDDEMKTLEKVSKFVKKLNSQDLEVITTLDYLVRYNYENSSREKIEKRLHSLKEWTEKIPKEKMDEYWSVLKINEMIGKDFKI